jgi:hypothetical protein
MHLQTISWDESLWTGKRLSGEPGAQNPAEAAARFAVAFLLVPLLWALLFVLLAIGQIPSIAAVECPPWNFSYGR